MKCSQYSLVPECRWTWNVEARAGRSTSRTTTSPCPRPSTAPRSVRAFLAMHRTPQSHLTFVTNTRAVLEQMYAGNHRLDHPLISPINASLVGLPPLLIQGTSHRVIKSDLSISFIIIIIDLFIFFDNDGCDRSGRSGGVAGRGSAARREGEARRRRCHPRDLHRHGAPTAQSSRPNYPLSSSHALICVHLHSFRCTCSRPLVVSPPSHERHSTRPRPSSTLTSAALPAKRAQPPSLLSLPLPSSSPSLHCEAVPTQPAPFGRRGRDAALSHWAKQLIPFPTFF
jgi:hypothetical protein